MILVAFLLLNVSLEGNFPGLAGSLDCVHVVAPLVLGQRAIACAMTATFDVRGQLLDVLVGVVSPAVRHAIALVDLAGQLSILQGAGLDWAANIGAHSPK